MGSGCSRGPGSRLTLVDDPFEDYEDFTIGIVGTGRMGVAHATLWTSLGFNVYLSSRDATHGRQEAQKIAQMIGGKCEGGGYATMINYAHIILLCILPGVDSLMFFDFAKPYVLGSGKMFVDMTAPYTEKFGPESRPPEPYKDHMNYLKDYLKDSSASWAKAFANIKSSDLIDRVKQPIEVAGDFVAKDAVMKMIRLAGFEPLDCGTAADVPGIEPCSPPYDRPERKRHPKHLEFHGPDHP
eukprot:TRINITY_DN31435_c0_g1_i1.p1 TRINITY_DN31435_c0_g1~~TRINITY_DN31435_c0_g1_i1.p1  ORF type:complete len:241 (+),score=38.23 TRINITY_DN31435_c0_g1_i1:60-782(+)